MIQLCGKSIVKPLKYLSESFLTAGIFLEDRKKGNIIPAPPPPPPKKSKDCVKNYRSQSQLPIFSKMFERLIFNNLFNFFVKSQLFTDCQSGFISTILVFCNYYL